MLQSPLVFQVFTFLICVPLVLTFPGQIKFFSSACVQWHKQVGAKVSVSKRNLCILQVLLRNKQPSNRVTHPQSQCTCPFVIHVKARHDINLRCFHSTLSGTKHALYNRTHGLESQRAGRAALKSASAHSAGTTAVSAPCSCCFWCPSARYQCPPCSQCSTLHILHVQCIVCPAICISHLC